MVFSVYFTALPVPKRSIRVNFFDVRCLHPSGKTSHINFPQAAPGPSPPSQGLHLCLDTISSRVWASLVYARSPGLFRKIANPSTYPGASSFGVLVYS